MLRTGFFLFFLSLSFVSGQLIGSRGVIKLKEGVEYRDADTVDSSKAVANFAKKYQPFFDDVAKKRKEQIKSTQNSISFLTKSQNKIGRKLEYADIFNFESSRLLDPLEELRFNKPLKEI
jgi:hypothetical protein